MCNEDLRKAPPSRVALHFFQAQLGERQEIHFLSSEGFVCHGSLVPMGLDEVAQYIDKKRHRERERERDYACI